MHREQWHDRLRGLDINHRTPMWVISYSRWNDSPWLARIRDTWLRQDDVHVLVRDSQVREYEQAFPRMCVIGAPDKLINSCGAARQHAADLALELGQETIIQFDDDVLKLDFLFSSVTKNGHPSSRASSNQDRERFPNMEELLTMLVGQVGEHGYARFPDLMLGGPRKRHMAFDPKNHCRMYTVNQGGTPRQVTFRHVARMAERGIRLDLNRFGVHGEDIGLTAQVLAAGGSCVTIPSMTFDHWAEDVNIDRSMIRNRDNAAQLHAEEYENLQHYPIRDYLRIRWDADGNYEWGDVDWRKYHKLHGTEPATVWWPEDDVI